MRYKLTLYKGWKKIFSSESSFRALFHREQVLQEMRCNQQQQENSRLIQNTCAGNVSSWPYWILYSNKITGCHTWNCFGTLLICDFIFIIQSLIFFNVTNAIFYGYLIYALKIIIFLHFHAALVSDIIDGMRRLLRSNSFDCCVYYSFYVSFR